MKINGITIKMGEDCIPFIETEGRQLLDRVTIASLHAVLATLEAEADAEARVKPIRELIASAPEVMAAVAMAARSTGVGVATLPVDESSNEPTPLT